MEKADAATKAEVAYSMCLPSHDAAGSGYMDIANSAGIPDQHIIPYATLSRSPEVYFTKAPRNGNKHFKVILDIVWLPIARLCDAVTETMRTGFLLDYEVSDDRNTEQATTALLAIAKMIHLHGYRVIQYNDPLDGIAPKSGLDPRIAACSHRLWTTLRYSSGLVRKVRT